MHGGQIHPRRAAAKEKVIFIIEIDLLPSRMNYRLAAVIISAVLSIGALVACVWSSPHSIVDIASSISISY